MRFSRFPKCQICGLVIALLSGCSNSKQLANSSLGQFVATPVMIDGDDSEWPSPYPYHDSKSMLSYAVSNDNVNLYISVKTGDEMVQRKLMVGGLIVWIDPTGKREEFMAIHYPQKGGSASMMPNRRRGEDGPRGKAHPFIRDSAMLRKPAIQIPNDLSFIGFANCSGVTTIHKSNSCGIRVQMNSNSYGELVWEASVPLTTLYTNGAESPKSSGKPVSICFEVGPMPMPAREGGPVEGGRGGGMRGGMPGGDGMPPGGAGGGRPGGGMGGPPGSGPGGRDGDSEKMELLSKTTKTWIQSSIAVK